MSEIDRRLIKGPVSLRVPRPYSKLERQIQLEQLTSDMQCANTSIPKLLDTGHIPCLTISAAQVYFDWGLTSLLNLALGLSRPLPVKFHKLIEWLIWFREER